MFHEFSWVFSLNTISLVSTYFLVLHIRTFFMTFYSHLHTFIKRFKVWCVVISGNENQIINKDMWAQPTNVDDGYTYICGRGSTSTLIRECSQQLFDNENKSQLVTTSLIGFQAGSDGLQSFTVWAATGCVGSTGGVFAGGRLNRDHTNIIIFSHMKLVSLETNTFIFIYFDWEFESLIK